MLDRNTPWRLHRVSLVPLLLAVSLPFGCQNPAQDCTPAGSCGTQTTTDGGSESGSTETRSTVGSSSDQAENSTSGEPTEPTVLDQVFDQAVAEGFSGVALVRYQGEVLLHSAAGFASREDGIANETDTPIVMGSITKQFTGAAILRLREQGGVELDETLADFFPNVPADNATLESVWQRVGRYVAQVRAGRRHQWPQLGSFGCVPPTASPACERRRKNARLNDEPGVPRKRLPVATAPA